MSETMVCVGEAEAERHWSDYLSWSGASTFRQCPLRWYRRYVLGEDDGETAEQRVGKQAHAILERFLAPEAEPSEARLAELVAEVCAGSDDEGLQAEGFARKAWGIHDTEIAHDTGRLVLGTEVELDGEVGGAPFKGFVDRIDSHADGTLTMVDYKTGKMPYGRRAADAFEQLRLYAAAHDGPVTRLELHYLKAGRVLTAEVSEPLADHAVASHATVWRLINELMQAEPTPEREFFPSVGPLCGWCGFSDSCTAGSFYLLSNPKYQGRRG